MCHKIIKKTMLLLMLMIISVTGCTTIENFISPPPPGWERDVKELLVEETAFPSGWQARLELEVDDYPQNNHVHRQFGSGTSAIVSQDIWRSYTTRDAKRKFNDLMESQFVPKRPLHPAELYLSFEPPSEIYFQSESADDFYLACGWWTIASCRVIARYDNYVVFLHLDHERDYEGHHTDGLNYQQMEQIIEAMDAKIVETLESYSE